MGATGEAAGEAQRTECSRCGPGTTRRKPVPAFAAVDLGTNNCRLLIARPAGDGFRVIDAFSRIVRLGEGLGVDGELSEAAVDRTLSALRVCAGKIRRNGVVAARAVATEACRRARNCAGFVSRVRQETGLDMEIISAGEEAHLALAGCASLLEPGTDHALVFDIGGGSTEVIWLSTGCDGRRPAEPEIIGSISLPCGVVGFSEDFGGCDVRRDAYAAMVGRVRAMLAPFDRDHGIGRMVRRGVVQMLGTSGTVTTLAAMHLGLARYDRSRVDGCYLTFGELEVVRDRLAAMSYEDRLALSCIGRGRADLVLAGSAILDAICQSWPVGRLRVADRGLREGILAGLMREHMAQQAAPDTLAP